MPGKRTAAFAQPRSPSRSGLRGYRPSVRRVVALSVVVAGVVIATVTAALATPPGKPGLIAFSSNRDGLPGIYTMRSDGSDIRRVTQTGAHSEGGPAWSPDGKRIAFVSEAPPPEPAPQYVTFAIYVVNADGTGLDRVTPIPSGALSKPSWSPDGQKIAYSTGVDGEATVHVINVDGTGDATLTKPSLSGEGPAWSPNGRLIAFSALPGRAPWQTCVMRSDGSHRRCFRHRGWQEYQPSWSPDGKEIVVSSTTPKGRGGAMLLMRADGSHRVNLTKRLGFGSRPSFSPDGRKLLFGCSDKSGESICVAGLRSGRASHLTSGGFDYDPDWQREPVSGRR